MASEAQTWTRWVFGTIIVAFICVAFIISSINWSHITVDITSDSETYNISKILADSAITISAQQDITYKELVKCQAEANFIRAG
jgi:hypothetical protein